MKMALLHIVCFVISFSVSFFVELSGKVVSTREAYYTKQAVVKTKATDAKALECGVKYLSEQFGVFKISDDGTECTTEPWAWFDIQDTETGYTYYRKGRMKLAFEPPLYLYSNESMPTPGYKTPFPSPMYSNSKVEVYFTPKLPMTKLAIVLLGVPTSNDICLFRAQGNSPDDNLLLTSWINGTWNPGAKQLYGDIPLNTEKTYKVTLKTTQLRFQLLIDNQKLMFLNHPVPSTEIRYLNMWVDGDTEIQLNRIEFLMKESQT